MTRTKVHLRAAEFFAGIGLVRLGLERQGWSVVFANDLDPQKKRMYQANFGDEHWNSKDVHTLEAEEVPNCDLFTASFPCNDLSIAGAWRGLNGKESSAFWGLVNVLKHSRRPPLVLLENVVGFLQSNGGKLRRFSLSADGGLYSRSNRVCDLLAFSQLVVHSVAKRPIVFPFACAQN
jgi:DNA (cytosine-5)-methyltransferase 1